MASIYDWSVTAGNNTTSDSGINWVEGQDPGTVNDSARAMMGRTAEILGDLGGALSAGGTANGLTVTANSAFTTLAEGRLIAFRATASNSAAATLNVNGIGAKSIRKMTTTGETALGAGDIQNTGIYVAQYSAALNGAAGGWLLVNPTIAVASIAPITMQTFTATGTWTKPAGCRFIVVEAVGGGGGAGGTTSALGNWGASGGGSSGFAGYTVPIDVTAVATGAVTIGAAGAASLSGNNAGGTGGTTQIIIGATTYTWPGGDGSPGNTANTSNAYYAFGSSNASVGSNTKGSSTQGFQGFSSLADTRAVGGSGAASPYGVGGDKTVISTTGGAGGNAAAANTGAGGGGCVSGNQASLNRGGGAGGSGFMRVWEYY